MFTFAIDWDGTCVENAWPEMGDWLPGAVEGLHQLDSMGKVVIYSCRVAAWEFCDKSEWRERRDVLDVAAEIAAMRRMLTKKDLGHLEIWTRDFKPPAVIYIDDKGFRFTGDWGAAVDAATEAIERERARG